MTPLDEYLMMLNGEPRNYAGATASPQAWMHGYPDPGDATGRMTYSSTPEQKGYNVGADEVKQALQAYLDWYGQPLPRPEIAEENGRTVVRNTPEMEDAAVGLGMGATGPIGAAGILKRVKSPWGVNLQSYRGTPEKLVGELNYSPASETASGKPYFGSIWSDTPKALAELFRGLEEDLGPRLNEMNLSPMVPEAIPFWESVAKNKRLSKYPGLRENIKKGTAAVRADDELRAYSEGESAIPKQTYGYNKGKGNPWASPTPEDAPRQSVPTQPPSYPELEKAIHAQDMMDTRTNNMLLRLFDQAQGQPNPAQWLREQGFAATVPMGLREAFASLLE